LALFDYRNMLTNCFIIIARVGTALANAGVDLNQVSQIADSANFSASQDRMTNLRADLHKWMQPGSAPPENMPSSNNCFHLQVGTPAPEEHGHYVPLALGITTFRGETTFAPHARFGIAVGTTYFNHNTEQGKLEINFQAASYLDFAHAKSLRANEAPQPTLYVGPPHVPEGRLPPSKPSVVANMVWRYKETLPADYKFAWREPGETCSQERMGDLERRFGELNMTRLVKSTPSLGAAFEAARTITKGVPCGAAYLRSSIPNSHSYDLFEAMVWGHFIVEWPADSVFRSITDPQWAD